MKNRLSGMTALAFVLLLTSVTTAQGPPFGRGGGRGFGRGAGGFGRGAGGHGPDERHQEDHDVFHFLLTNHEKITRKVTQLPDGVETLTESDDPEISDKIKEHVQWMKYRIEETHPIRMRDPLFAELFQHTDKIKMKHEDTEKGVRVVETSDDPYVAKLIKAHAEAVSGFVSRGFDEAMKNHPVPERGEPKKSEPTTKREFAKPTIKNYGQVASLPKAAHQPRDGSKICVDLTQGGPPHKLNPAIEKVARFVNIYSGAGKTPAAATIAIVLHGDATLAVLHPDAYTERFGTQTNPNLDCLHELHEAGVEIYVCGQSLIRQGGNPEDAVVFTEVAVSGLTALVNLQADGYAYMPLLQN